ncbi:hypothetical protein M405DRAFT_747736, partial [Rhizopogon salebrosus TDB-379]
RENYGAGLLRFHQFCDEYSISEHQRMPASEHLLAAFICSWIGKVASTTADNWLAGLHLWHDYHGAPWNGHNLVRRSRAALSKHVPESSCRPRRPPVTLEHMHTLYQRLDLSNSFDSAVFCIACTAFWSCCHLGELLISSINAFNPSRHVSRSAPLHHRQTPNGISFSTLHIPWSKTTLSAGADVIITKIDDITNPFTALHHHLAANNSLPPEAPFFAFETVDGGWAPMTRPWFLARCNQIWRDASLLELSGHCFRIGGATELLLRGTPPDIVAVQGRWKSKAFLDYWHRIESILPLFITGSFTDARVSLLQSSIESFSRQYK